MNPPSGIFANDAAWYIIVFEVSAFYFFLSKTGDRKSSHGSFHISNTVCFENLKLNHNNQYTG